MATINLLNIGKTKMWRSGIDSKLTFEPVSELNQVGIVAFESIFDNVLLSPGNTVTVGVICTLQASWTLFCNKRLS